MHNHPLTTDERLKCPRCPWCDGWCQYVETDNHRPLVRVGSSCNPWEAAFEDGEVNDAFGNDWGRGEWSEDVDAAIADYARRVAKHKAGEKDVW